MADLIDRSKRLIEYLPPFMQQFKEIKEVMCVEDAELDIMSIDIEKILNNAFIEDCDEYGIRKYENLLGIIPSQDDTLEARKSRVLLYWNITIPYTYRTLIRTLNTMCGVNNYDVMTDFMNYSIEFNIYKEEHITEVEKLLDDIFPQNLFYKIYETKKSVGKCSIGAVWQDDEIFNLRQVIV